MQAKFMKEATTFKNYSNYDFDDDVRDFYTEEVNVFSGKVNENGKTDVTLKPTISSQAPGKLKIVMQTKAFESGGDFSTDVVSASFSPYKTYVGLKSPTANKYGFLETDKINKPGKNIFESENPLRPKTFAIFLLSIGLFFPIFFLMRGQFVPDPANPAQQAGLPCL